jgi:hypothetical protein
MPQLLGTQLALPRCPHCGIDSPNLEHRASLELKDLYGHVKFWRAYSCRTCASVVVAKAPAWDLPVEAVFPASQTFSDDLPPRAREYLVQAFNTLSSPAGAVMLAASAVDSMLKAKGLTAGNLYTRIDQAAASNLITQSMAKWAHEVRLDANDQRHADDSAPLPDQAQARKCVDFAIALGDFLFTLPARVERGIAGAAQP